MKGEIHPREYIHLSVASNLYPSPRGKKDAIAGRWPRNWGLAGRKKPASLRRPQWDTNGRKSGRNRGAALETLGGC